MPNIKSTCYPDRRANSFNEWQEDMHFERELEKCLENLKYNLKQKIKRSYYEKRSTNHSVVIHEDRIMRSVIDIIKEL
jgi:hypothetical protein